MKVMGKGLRLAIFLVVFIVAFVLFAFVVAGRGDEFSRDYDDIMLAGSSCFVGSAFFVLAYDTFYKDRGGKKGFLQKVFTLIGFIFTAVFGIVAQVLYYQNFEVSQKYSPFLFALGAPWLMSGLLTLLLFEVKFKNSNGLLKIALPFISLIVCYILYVILGFAGRSSAFVYAGIGSVICAVLAVVLLGFLKVLGRMPKNSGSNADSSSGEENKHPKVSLVEYFEKGISGYTGGGLGFHTIYDETPFSVSVQVNVLSPFHECYVHVVLHVNMERLRVNCMDFGGTVHESEVENKIKEMENTIKNIYNELVNNLPQQFNDYKFNLEIETIHI